MNALRGLLLVFFATASAFAADARKINWKKVAAEDYSEGQIAAAKRVALYAIFANNSYAETPRRPHFQLPHDWSLNESLGVDDKKSGLHYEVWEHHTPASSVDEVVVAFRGTEDARDWEHGNIGDNQYKLVDATFPRVLANYHQANVSAVGHSLGGGLALHCSLKWPGVAAVGFNPSTRVHQHRSAFENTREIVTEHGDPLGLQRSVWRHLPHVPKERYDFVHGSDHFSYSLAAGLLSLAASVDSNFASLLDTQRAKGLPLPPTISRY